MGKKVMEKSNLKLLLNAEPFGFGPTAAIATFFPYLREKFSYMGYLGKHHTLDLQNDLSYDAIHDTSQLSEENIKSVLSKYDIFVTALDFETAVLAKSLGLKVVIYDPLTWYWKLIPEIVGQSDLYLAQDFFGVKERLHNEPNLFPQNVQMVPPIVSQKRPRTSKQYTLINLGGLQNPLWSLEDVFQYAKTFVETIKKCVSQDDKLIITTSNAIAVKLEDSNVRSYNRAEMYEILENTKYAFMTSGLGNIYDAAKFDIPTIWLPPANDSQGQQLDLLKKHGMSDGQMDWADLGKPIDYFAEQTIVLKNIKEAIYSTTDQTLLKTAMSKVCEGVNKKESSATSTLLDEFGTGGAEKVGELVFQYSQSIT
jgi:hypothetical protein